ncbi:Hsp20/alpha crystallin family protein [Thomasclavelia spiroformis]|uniref:Hsp20/alpha crystallin family protein n=1 Tax=Thomasclavelia spiroformis TaxID=29348 RepID=UPI00241F29C3|nr:Hsp20/alpha crystallin family protein [Thomasclavelia spiroformis]
MKLLPGLTTFNNLFDDMFDDSFFRSYNSYMKTDIKEVDNQYVLDIEMPGFNKKDISVELNDGYLTISGNKSTNNDEKDTKGNIIRQERYSGSYSRSFYVGDSIKKEDIKANYDNGELKIYLPKTTKEVENHNYIPIE